MTDPNPLREDEVEAVARVLCVGEDADYVCGHFPDGSPLYAWMEYDDTARAAITALDQVREGRASEPR